MSEESDKIIKMIDSKMGDGWASKFANVLACDMALKADITFTFEKLALNELKLYSAERTASLSVVPIGALNVASLRANASKP